MKTFLVSACMLLAASSVAQAQENLNLPASYAEIAVGASFIQPVNTDTYTFHYGSTTASGRIALHYQTAVTGGAELGVAGVGMPEIRLGVSYEFLPATFGNGTATGTVNGTSGSATFTRSDALGAGINLDNDVHLVTGNIYYSLPLVGKIRPYFGIGAGAAMVEHADAQFALTGTLGARAALSDAVYVGLRYRYYRIEGPTDSLGIRYSAITNHSVMALLGLYLD